MLRKESYPRCTVVLVDLKNNLFIKNVAEKSATKENKSKKIKAKKVVAKSAPKKASKPAAPAKENMPKVVVKAGLKNALISPQKLRLVADLIRGKSVEKSEQILEFTRKKGAKILIKLLKSAIANAENNFDLDKSVLIVSKIVIDEGIKYPRYRFASRGRVHKYVRRRSHALIELSERK